ncbi:MAG: translocation protein TolB, partial [Proteobacteria bacterium]|nr:translocation protein TolB [Pseudomonadota bacterium]
RWHEVPNPNPNGGQTPTCSQVPQATPFNRGEGLVYSKGQIYFATTGDNTVWQYDPLTDTICVRYDAAQDPSMQLTAPDNLAAASNGVIAAEDGGNMELVLLGNNGVASPLLRVTGQDSSEITGPAFDPSGWRLYFSSQTGTSGNGITYEVSGPFVQRRSGNGRC